MRVLYEGKRLIIQSKQDYSNLFKPSDYNWVEYTPVSLRFEVNKMFGQVELEVALLGFHLHLDFVYNKKRHAEECERIFSKAKKSKNWVEL